MNFEHAQCFQQSDRHDFLQIETRKKDNILVPVISDEIRRRLSTAEGRIPYPLTNDRAFRGLASYSEDVQRNLAAILLNKKPDDIYSVENLNPISFGQRIVDRRTEEDVRLLINHTIMLDIEMQNLYIDTNTRRFLLYLCRNFNSIHKKKDYNELRSNLLIGIMNYSFEKEQPEFYSQYRLQNVKTGKPLFEEDTYFGFNFLDLNNSALADDQDQSSGRTLLAALCKANTWEEIRELAKQSAFAEEVAEIMYASNADLREQIAMDDALRYEEMMTTMENAQKRAEDALKQSEEENKSLRSQVTDLEKQIEKLKGSVK